MNEVAHLEIEVTSGDVATADRRLGRLTRTGGRAERATDGLTSAFKRFAGPAAIVAATLGGLAKITEVTRQFDKINAGLITATGNAENAASAFDAIRDFATETPYDLGQVADSFTKLVNYGLEPSERALKAYGDASSAMGKDLNQMIEAVADAATGEFERLKEFGIKANKQGDQVSFTFRGVKETIAFEAEEIENYLIKLSENNFAGAMEERMDSLDGAMSNLGDEWDKLFLNISEAGVGDAIELAVRIGIGALEEMNATLASGELEGYMGAIAGKFSAYGEDIGTSFNLVTKYLLENFDLQKVGGVETADAIIDGFMNMPENIRALVQLVTVELAHGFDRWVADATYWKEKFTAAFTDDTAEAAFERWQKKVEAIGGARMDSIQGILAERNSAVESFEAQIQKSRELRDEYDEQQAARRAATEDRLAQFEIETPGGGGGAGDGVDEAAAKRRQKQFQGLVEYLRTEEEAIRASYEERRKIIEQNTAAGSDRQQQMLAKLQDRYQAELAELEEAKTQELSRLQSYLMTEEESVQQSYDERLRIIRRYTEEGSAIRAEMTSRLNELHQEELDRMEEARQQERDRLYNGLLSEEEMLLRSYERRREAILESEAITGEQRIELMRRLEQQYMDEQQAMEQERMAQQMQAGQQLFDGLAGLAKSYAGEQSDAYRTLFAISKAFSIAQSAMSIATGLAKAQELGFPANLAEMARVAATGASIMAQVQGQQFSGAYDKGGSIPAGKFGIVGEYGPEIVEGPSKVTSRAETAKMLKEAQNGGGDSGQPAPQVNLRNVNVLDPSLVGDYLSTDEGEDLIVNVVQKNQRALGG